MEKKLKTTGVATKEQDAPSGKDGMIFKVQLSMMSSDNKRHIYIYDESRKYQWQQLATKELLKTFREPKEYWHGYISGDERIILTSKAEPQPW